MASKSIPRLAGAVASGLLLALGLSLSPASPAGPMEDQIRKSGQLRACIWPDYYGVSFRNPRTGKLVGIDIELSAELAKDLGVRLVHVDSSFATLIEDLKADRCDVAMFAVGITPARQQHLKFSQPYMRSDIYGVTTVSNRVIRSWADIDQPGVRVAVQAGTFMEPVMAAALKQAELVVVRPPQTREAELESGRVDVFMTDYPYSRRLLDNADWARLVSSPKPYHPIPYAYAIKPGDEAWLARLDAFVAAIKRDGRLAAAAKRAGLEPIALTQ